MDSIRKCINAAGSASRVRLPEVPCLEREVELGEEAVSALRCWDARPGEIFTVCDPLRGEYRARLTSLDDSSATLLPFTAVPATESVVRIELLQALPEKERFELVLQKATELGVDSIVPYQSAKSTTLDERDAGQKKSHRWPDVLLRAARQCRRAQIPALSPVLPWDEALDRCVSAELSLICYEGETGWTLFEALQGFNGQNVSLMVGPEGGFSKDEVEQASARGVLPVSLGPRVMRTETAAILAVGAIQFALGDLGR